MSTDPARPDSSKAYSHDKRPRPTSSRRRHREQRPTRRAHRMGCQFGQGYLLGRPTAATHHHTTTRRQLTRRDQSRPDRTQGSPAVPLGEDTTPPEGAHVAVATRDLRASARPRATRSVWTSSESAPRSSVASLGRSNWDIHSAAFGRRKASVMRRSRARSFSRSSSESGVLNVTPWTR